jgi:hypothetical protein
MGAFSTIPILKMEYYLLQQERFSEKGKREQLWRKEASPHFLPGGKMIAQRF